jgi:hypothetical protein
LRLLYFGKVFLGKNIGHSVRLCTLLGHLGKRNTERIISFCHVTQGNQGKYSSNHRVSLSQPTGIIALNFAIGKTALANTTVFSLTKMRYNCTTIRIGAAITNESRTALVTSAAIFPGHNCYATIVTQ